MLDYIVFHYLPFLRRFPSGIGEVIAGLPIAFAVCAVYWLIRRAWHKKRLGADFAETRRRCRLNESVRLLFVAWITMMYLLCLCEGIGWVKRWFSNPLFLLPPYRAYYSFTRFNYVFSLLKWGFDRTFMYDIMLNTALFVPLGLALPIMWKKADFRVTLLVGFTVTYVIELRIQPFIGRNSSIDDIIANTLGTVIGYILFMLLRKLFPKFIESSRLTVKVKSMYS